MIIKTQLQIRVLSSLNITGSIGLLIWWLLFPVFLPIKDASVNFQNLILDPNWTVLNLVGLVSCLFLCLGLPGFYIAHYKHFKTMGFIGLLLACSGLILFTAIQYYETLIWPAAVKVNPELLYNKGVLVAGNSNVVLGLLGSGIILGVGYVLFGCVAIRTKMYPLAPLLCLMSGAVVFGNGVLFLVRTAGLILFVTGTIWLSILIVKQLTNQKHKITQL
jgi:hypothetical protein